VVGIQVFHGIPRQTQDQIQDQKRQFSRIFAHLEHFGHSVYFQAAEKLVAALASTSSGSSASADPSNTKKQIARNIPALA
jgi:hypothetical protein